MLGNQMHPRATVVGPRLPCSGLAVCVSSSGRRLAPFSTLGKVSVLQWVGGFPDFCEPSWQTTQSWERGRPGLAPGV